MIKLERDGLVAAIKKVLPGVEKGATKIEGADQLLFTGTQVSSYNGVVAVSAPCDTQGAEFSIKGMDFFNLVSHMDDPEFTMEISSKKAKFKSGRTKATMSLMDATNIKSYIEALSEDVKEFKPVPVGFMDTVRLCSIGNNASEARGVAIGKYEDSSAVYCTDTNRIALCKLSGDMDSFWVEDPVLVAASKVGIPKEYAVSGVWIHFRYEDGSVFSSQRKNHEKYPFDKCAPLITKALVTESQVSGIFPASLGDAVSRVAILASGIDGKSSSLVEMTFRKDELELHAEKMGGEATETIPWEKPLDSDPAEVSVWVDISFLLEASRKSMSFDLKNIGGNPCLVFRQGDYTQMVATFTK